MPQTYAERFPIEFSRQFGLVAKPAADHGSLDVFVLDEVRSNRAEDSNGAERSSGGWSPGTAGYPLPIAQKLDLVRRWYGGKIVVADVDQQQLESLINEVYEGHARTTIVRQRQTASEQLEDLLTRDSGGGRDDLLEQSSLGEVVTLVNGLLLDAIQRHASDVHLQPFEDAVSVRYRIDGVLIEVQKLPRTAHDEVVSRLKVAGGMNIAEKRLPQDGRASVRVGNRMIDLRLASMPTSFGERMVVRLLDKSARLYTLPELGMDPTTLERFNHLIAAEHGLILVTGPTGSGKSTTLYAALDDLDTDTRNAVTLEDPIEYQLSGISQTQINVKKGMTFASGLRSVLRQDPDIIMLGEIRDSETAVMAVQSSLTGHLVFSTLHTNDAASAVTRLLDLGIEPYLVASSLLGVLAQRLVRRVCPVCGGPPEPVTSEFDPAAVGRIDSAASVDCTNCDGSGFAGRLGIYELLLVDEPIRELIVQQASATQIRDCGVRGGMRLLSEGGQRLVEQRLTVPSEVQRVTMRASM